MEEDPGSLSEEPEAGTPAGIIVVYQ